MQKKKFGHWFLWWWHVDANCWTNILKKKKHPPEHVDWQLWNSIILICFNMLSSNRQPCHTHGDLQAMQHSHQSQPRFWSWEGWSLIVQEGHWQVSISHPWVTITGWAHLMIYFQVTDLRHCAYKPSKTLLYIVKSNTKFFQQLPLKTSENGNHQDQTNKLQRLPRMVQRNMLVTEEMRFPQIPKAPLAKSGYLLHGRQRPSNASQISCKI